MLRGDFPIFANNPWLVYLDSAATTQKPSYVINGITQYLEHDYANIHRGRYSLSERSEEMYWETRKKVASFIWAEAAELVFCANSTAASNLLIQSLLTSDMLQAGDTILLSPLEHHANIVPWQMAVEQVGCMIERMDLTEDLSLDMFSLQQKAQKAKIVSIAHVSNVTGEIFDLQHIQSLLPETSLFVVDASQSAPHIPLDVQKIACDFLWFTGHKMLASTGIGVLYGRKELLQAMQPSIGGGSAIASVTREGYSLLEAPDKFEPGTPNLVGVVSLLRALEYYESLGGIVRVWEIEHELVEKLLLGLLDLEQAGKITLLWPHTVEKRIGLCSFLLPAWKNPHQLGQWMAEHNICIRCGGLCAQPLHEQLGQTGSCRVSVYIYNTIEEVTLFLNLLEEFLAD